MHNFISSFPNEVLLLPARFAAAARPFFCLTLTGKSFAGLEGGRWTKDWCGGDQQWRLRLSGRGWTDRRRSG
jgi:hypothetical protein